MIGLVRKILGEQASCGELQTIIRGLPNNVTTEMDLALWRLSTSIREDPASAEAFTGGEPAVLAESYRDGWLARSRRAKLASFLGDYGHRAVAEIDLGMPRWSDDPAHVLGVVANYLRLERGAGPVRAVRYAARAPPREQSRAPVVARARAEEPTLHAAIVPHLALRPDKEVRGAPGVTQVQPGPGGLGGGARGALLLVGAHWPGGIPAGSSMLRTSFSLTFDDAEVARLSRGRPS